jgi:Tol biopolymer transport system component
VRRLAPLATTIVGLAVGIAACRDTVTPAAIAPGTPEVGSAALLSSSPPSAEQPKATCRLFAAAVGWRYAITQEERDRIAAACERLAERLIPLTPLDREEICGAIMGDPGFASLPQRIQNAIRAFCPVLPSLIVFSSVEPAGSDLGGPEGEIYTVLSDGSNLTRLTNDKLLDQSPALSPNGSTIVWANRRDAFFEFENIWVMPVSGASRVQLTLDAGVIDAHPAWSFDGSRIAFMSTRDLHSLPEGRELYVMNADGSGQARVTNNLFWDDTPNWSPDARIAFRSIRSGESDIYVINPDGTNEVRLTTTGNNGSPSWSPDGQRIAFVSSRDGNDEIYVMRADGSSHTRLTLTPAVEETPTWSPDGSQIAFGSNREGGFQIDVMNADGSQQERITSLPTPSVGPRWRN